MKVHDTTTVFKHKFIDICSIFFNRYPSPYSAHVISEDTISRRLDGCVLKTIRLYHKKNGSDIPRWLQPFLPSPTAYIYEESHVDLSNNAITTYTKNLSLTSLLSVEEKCTFSEEETNKKWTTFKRIAWMESYVFGFSGLFESYGSSRYKSNTQRMENGFNYVLQKDYVSQKDVLINTNKEVTSDVLSQNNEMCNIRISNSL